MKPIRVKACLFILLVKACFVMGGCSFKEYPRLTPEELDARMVEVDRLIELCQTAAEVGHPPIDIEDERFSACIKEAK